MNKLPIVVLISGQGTNLQAIIEATKKGLAVDIRAVISNHPEAPGLDRAKAATLPTHVIDHKKYLNRETFEAALQQQIDHYKPALIVLAGFMRKLTSNFVNCYPGRIINIHPSLLPKYPGLNTHERVLKAGDNIHGVSIHYVTEEVDGGPLICQTHLTVKNHEDVEALKHRIHAL